MNAEISSGEPGEQEVSEPNEVDMLNEKDELVIDRDELPIIVYSTFKLCGRDMGMTKPQLITVVILSLSFFFNWAYFSLFVPFFPKEALKKGMDPSKIGIIFGIFQFVLLICSPIFGKYMNKIGVKFLMASGLFLGSGSMISFGFLNRSPHGNTYFILCVVSRIVTAIGSSMACSYGIAGYFFPKRVASIVAVLEVFTGLGLMIGPVIGGSLYDIGGFELPFFFMGVMMGILFLVTLAIFPSPEQVPEDNENAVEVLPMLPLLKIPKFTVTIFLLLCSSTAINFINPSIQLHLTPLGLNPFQLGFVFLVPAMFYTVVTPFVGIFCDKFPKLMPGVMVLSALTFSLAYSLFGPLPWFHMKLTLKTCLSGYSLFGISYSGLVVPVYAELAKIAEENNYPKDIRTHGLISGIFSCIYSAGAFLGPILGGIIVELYGFNMSTFFVVILFIATAFIFTSVYVLTRQNPSETSNSLDLPSPTPSCTESTPLLKEHS